MKKKTTIADVAAAAAVSISTASKALNGTGTISEETVHRVHDAARRLGYQPNYAAQLLPKKNKTIGILFPTVPESVYSLYTAGLSDALNEYHSLGFSSSFVTYDRYQPPQVFADALLQMQKTVDALIFINTYADPICISTLQSLTIPKISLQTAVPSEICPSVTIHGTMVGKIAAEYLHTVCHGSTMAVITGYRTLSLHKQNIEGFIQEAQLRGLHVLSVEENFDEYSVAYGLTKQLLQTTPQLSGIFVTNYAAPAVCACLKEHGRAGINGVRVIGLDVFEDTAACLRDGSLTATIYQNQKQQARKAVELIAAKLRNVPVESCYVKPELVLSSNLSYYL